MRPETAHDAEVDRDDPALGVDEKIALMHVGVEKAVAQGVAQKGLDQRPRQRARIEAERLEAFGIGERDAVHPLHRHDFARGAVPVDRRGADVGIVLRVLGEFRSRRRLQAEIHLHPHRAGQRLDDLDEAQAADFRDGAFGEPRGEEHVREVAGEALLHAGAQHLDGDGTRPLRGRDRGAVNLRDRGRRDRFAEVHKHRLDLGAEGGLDDGDRGLAAHRRHPVLQALELEGDLGPDDVGPGRQELPHLDVGGPEPIDRAGKSGQSR